MSVVSRLYDTLSQRWLPEQVVEILLERGPSVYSPAERRLLEEAKPRWKSSMSNEFARVSDPTKQLKVAAELFPKIAPPRSYAPKHVAEYIEGLKNSLDATPSPLDFKKDRLARAERKKIRGVPKGHRQYNKRFRLIARLEKKYGKWVEVANIRDLAQFSKSRLASKIQKKDLTNIESAAFVAYLAAKMNKRSMFTFGEQERAYDEIAEVLFKRLPKSADWFAIAHVHPEVEVLNHLTERQKGAFLGRWYEVMQRAAQVLAVEVKANDINLKQMIVRRGNDSSTWNEAAGAFNRAREGWINTLYALGLEATLDEYCPGKALRLMAADVAWGHREYGDGLDPDTQVWGLLPKPWDVIVKGRNCHRSLIEKACKKAGVTGNGWLAPRSKTVAEFHPTPELVHGVVVSSPALARRLKSLNYFAGPTKGPTKGFTAIWKKLKGLTVEVEDGTVEETEARA